MYAAQHSWRCCLNTDALRSWWFFHTNTHRHTLRAKIHPSSLDELTKTLHVNQKAAWETEREAQIKCNNFCIGIFFQFPSSKDWANSHIYRGDRGGMRIGLRVRERLRSGERRGLDAIRRKKMAVMDEIRRSSRKVKGKRCRSFRGEH